MPSSPIPFPSNPSVPIGSLGLPPLSNPINIIIPAIATADAFGLFPLARPQWGIYDTLGNPLIISDSVYSVEYSRDYRISDYPQQNGSFESYNKVQIPFQAKVTFLIGGSDADRAEFLNTIEPIVASLNFVTVVTPEITYALANLTHYAYRREARRGIKLLSVDIWCEEVRVNAQSQYTNAQNINGATQAQNGVIQPINTTPNANGTFSASGFPNVESTGVIN